MYQLLWKYKLLGFALFLFFIFIIITAATLSSRNNAPSPLSGPTITPVPVDIQKQGTKILSPYLKTSINKTNDAQVNQLPGLKSKSTSGTTTTYHFESLNLLRDNSIITNGTMVIYERAVTFDSNYIHPLISEYTNKYGPPEAEFEGSKQYGKFRKTYVYASKGFAFIANPYTEEIDEIQTFQPMTIDEYKKLWGEDIGIIAQQEKI